MSALAPQGNPLLPRRPARRTWHGDQRDADKEQRREDIRELGARELDLMVDDKCLAPQHRISGVVVLEVVTHVYRNERGVANQRVEARAVVADDPAGIVVI